MGNGSKRNKDTEVSAMLHRLRYGVIALVIASYLYSVSKTGAQAHVRWRGLTEVNV